MPEKYCAAEGCTNQIVAELTVKTDAVTTGDGVISPLFIKVYACEEHFDRVKRDWDRA